MYRLFFRDPWIFAPLALTVVLQALMWWYAGLKLHGATEQFFLHSSIIFGVDLVGAPALIYYIPSAGILLALLNYSAGFLLYGKDKILARLISFLTAFIQLAILAGVWHIIGLNI